MKHSATEGRESPTEMIKASIRGLQRELEIARRQVSILAHFNEEKEETLRAQKAEIVELKALVAKLK